MKKLSILLAGLLLCSCSARTEPPAQTSLIQVPMEEKDSTPAVISMLQNVDSTATPAEISLAFSTLLSHTLTSYPDGLEIYTTALDHQPAWSEDGLVEETFQVDTVYTSWLDDGLLYQAARYRTGQENVQGVLSRTSDRENTSIICLLEGSSPFGEPEPHAVIEAIEREELSIEGEYDQNRLQQILNNRRLQYVYGAIGGYLALSVLEHPELFRYTLHTGNDGYVFSISPSSMDEYNRQADLLDPARGDIFHDGSLEARDYRSDQISMDIILNGDGIITSVIASYQDSFTFEEEKWEIAEESQLFLSAPLQEEGLAFMQEIFTSVDDHLLEAGSSFVFRVPVSQLT